MGIADREHVDKRDFIRMDIQTPIKFVRTINALSHYGNTKNLSGNGILFISEDTVEVGERIEVTVAPQAGHFAPLKASVQVTRVNAITNEKYEVAGKIVKIL